MPDEARELKYWEDHDWVMAHAPWAKTMVAFGWRLCYDGGGNWMWERPCVDGSVLWLAADDGSVGEEGHVDPEDDMWNVIRVRDPEWYYGFRVMFKSKPLPLWAALCEAYLLPPSIHGYDKFEWLEVPPVTRWHDELEYHNRKVC